MTAQVIAIDGPSGAGKSTLARAVASELGMEMLDTGAMYRAVALAVLEANVSLDSETECGEIAQRSNIAVGDRTFLDGRDVTELIRSPEVTRIVSEVAIHPSVRAVLIKRQRDWIKERGRGVLEGRDMGTIVFPDAVLKVYLTASGSERARRRQRDEQQANRESDVEEVLLDLERRDIFDSTRGTLPPKPPPDALVIDTTNRSVEELTRELVERYRAAVGPEMDR